MHQAQAAVRSGRWGHDPLQLPEMRRIEAVASGLYMRSRSMFEGACLLADDGFVLEAGFLARSLYVESLWLAHLSTCPESARTAWLVAFANKGLTNMINAAKEAHSLGAEPDLNATLAPLEATRANLLRWAHEEGVGKLPALGDEIELAKAHGRTEDLLSYRMSHEFVHGSDIALGLRRDGSGTDVSIYTRDADAQVLAELCAFAGRSILHAHLAFSSYIGWPPGDEAAAALDAINRAIEEEIRGTAVGPGSS